MTTIKIVSISCRFTVFVFVSLFLAHTTAANIPGGSGGSFAVTDAGAASYTIPIIVPPGTAGMEPSLSINYNSSSGNGVLGIGSSLGGISSISRCPRTLAQDGVYGGVNHDQNDRFCLDGNRLINVSGAYGGNGTIYRTELDNFSQIRSFGTITNKNGGTAPAWFEVRTKDGQILDFGLEQYSYNTYVTNARMELPGANYPHRWLLSRIRDRKGNFIEFRYSEVSNQCLPYQIRYGGNINGATGPNRLINFNYVNRGDQSHFWTEGGKIRNTKLLQKIETRFYNTDNTAWETAREYEFSYQTGGATGRSRLRWVRDCALKEDGTRTCLRPTYFDWKAQEKGWTTGGHAALPGNEVMHHYVKLSNHKHLEFQHGQLIDINGDGLPDWVKSYRDQNGSDNRATWLNTGSGWAANTAYKLPDYIFDYKNALKEDNSPDAGTYAITRGQFADVNGDGLVDWLRAYRNKSGTFYKATWLNTGSGWARAETKYELRQPLINYNWAWVNTAEINGLQYGQLIDVNGDGLVDQITAVKTPAGNVIKSLYLNKPTGGWTLSTYNLPDVFVDYSPMWSNNWYNPKGTPINRGTLIDLNGDGIADWLRSYTNASGTHYNYSWINTGNGWRRDDSYALPSSTTLRAYNYKNDSGGTRDLSKGSLVDVNGDGLTDWVVAWRTPGGSQKRLTYMNTGHGWKPDNNYSLPSLYADYLPHYPEFTGMFADVTGDGLIDWVRSYRDKDGTDRRSTWINNGSGWTGRTSAYPTPDVLFNYNWFYADPNSHLIPRIEIGARYGTFADINGDGTADWVRGWRDVRGNNYKYTYLAKSDAPDLVTKIIDPLTAETDIIYKPLTAKPSPTLYYPRSIDKYSISGFTNPKNIDIRSSGQVVWKHGQSDGSGTYKYWFRYNYSGLRVNTQGRGGLGFRWRQIFDEHTGMRTTRWFWQHYPFIGRVYNQYTQVPDGAGSYRLTGQTITTFSNKSLVHANGNKTNFVHVQKTDSKNLEPHSGNQLIARAITTNTYDDLGNPTYVKVDNTGGYATETRTTYDNYTTANWLIGLPKRIESTANHPIQPSQTRVVQNTFYGWGAVATSIVDPGTPMAVNSIYEYDDFGNRTKTTINAADIPVRASTVQYDHRGQFPIRATNALGHSETYTHLARCGTRASQTGPNGLTTTWEYDQFCRPSKVIAPDGNYTVTVYDVSKSNTETDPFYIRSYGPGQPNVYQYFDILGRTYKTRTQGFADGSWVLQNIFYDKQGRVRQTSLPYHEGTNPAGWNRNTYDILGRVIQTKDPDGNATSIDYQGRTQIVTNALGQTKETRVNARGEVTEVIDNIGNTMRYEYDSAGNLLKTIDPHGNEIVLQYDLRGRKIAMDDPDMGFWTYDYNSIDQLTSQTDANQNTITTQYDLLGRLKSRTAPEGTSTWTYDTAQMGVGKLHTVSGPDGYQRMHSYDSLGRPSNTQTTIEGRAYNSSVTYDWLGRVSTVTYPGQAYTVRSVYNARSFLTELQDATTGNLLWQVNELDADGKLTHEMLGNGVGISNWFHPRTRRLGVRSAGANTVQQLSFIWDGIGNLTSRTDSVIGETETFTYDDLNRLSSATLGSGQTKGATYDAIGNILWKSDVGGYNYDTARPHAVATINNGLIEPDFIPPQIDLNGQFQYDNNGNLLHVGAVYDAGGQLLSSARSVTWTSFNKPATLSSVGNTVSFTYGPDFERLTKSVGNKKTTYIGKSYERIEESGDVKHKYYISAGSATIEVEHEELATTVNENIQYLHKDHLGSTDVITDENGNVVERLSFDPWGQRREVNWTHAPVMPTSLSTRGFTGHEMDDEVGLINMNARIYDPILGRFLSPDPMLPDPSDAQAYNRYSYVYNNPLKLTDPSGFEPDDPGRYTPLASHRPASGNAGSFGHGLDRGNGDAGLANLNPLKQNEHQALAAAANALGLSVGQRVAPTYHINEDRGVVRLINRGTPTFGNYDGPFLSDSERKMLYGIASGRVDAPAGVSAAQLAGAVKLINQAYGFSQQYIKYQRARSRGRYRSIANMALMAVGGYTAIAAGNGTQFAMGQLTNIGASAFDLGGTASSLLGLLATGDITNLGAIGMEVLGAVAPEVAAVIGVVQTIRNFSHVMAVDGQRINPAQTVADRSLQDGHLSLGEANEIWRNNTDPNFTVTVDASQLTVRQDIPYFFQGIAPGTVQGSGDFLVYGTVELRLNYSNGGVNIGVDRYDFQQHGNFWDNPIRNFEAYGGFWEASRAGFQVGTDFNIQFRGQPNVVQ